MVKRYKSLPDSGFDAFRYDGKARLIQWDWILLDRKVGPDEGVGSRIRIYDPVSLDGGMFWVPVSEFEFRD